MALVERTVRRFNALMYETTRADWKEEKPLKTTFKILRM